MVHEASNWCAEAVCPPMCAAASAKGEVMAVTKGEQVLWQQKWLQCCQELNQWEPIQDYARSTEHYGLLMDCLWRAQDWTTLKQEVMPKAHVSPIPPPHPK